MICQSCGTEAPTKHIELYQNIGALVVRFHKSVKGRLCKSCINKYFWQFTTITFFAGWWGTISFFFTIFILFNNIIRYMGALSLPPVPAGATPPTLGDETIAKLENYRNELVSRLNEREALEVVSQSIAPRAGVTPGQIYLYVSMLAKAAKEQT